MNRRKWSAEQVLWHFAPPGPLDLAELARLAADRSVPVVRWVGDRHEWLTPEEPALGNVTSAPLPGAAQPKSSREGTRR